MIRKIQSQDRQVYLQMAKDFYSSSAVSHAVPKNYYEKTFEEIISRGIYAEGYIFESGGEIAGYALISKTYSQEAGGIVVWLEEIYILNKFQGKGLGKEFFDYLENNLQGVAKRIRLEVTHENKRAIKLYEQLGFVKIKYKQMMKDLK